MSQAHHLRPIRCRYPVILIVTLFVTALASCKTPGGTADVKGISFASENLDEWRTRAFAGKTHYEIVTLDRAKVLQAESHNSASAILREIQVDLTATPVISWRWRVDNTYGDGINERSQQGDDYPARLYVVASDGFQPWEVIAINYVWSSNQPVGTHWPNAWTSQAQMLALRSGSAEIRQWHSEKRNIRQDFKLLFNRDVDAIKAVAIMVDSDNSGGMAKSYFGDIRFSAE